MRDAPEHPEPSRHVAIAWRQRSERRGIGNERGAALVVIILMIALMLCLGAIGTRTSQVELRIAHNDVLNKQAFEAAEAGLTHAFALLKRDDAISHLNGAANGFDDELSGGGVGGSLAALGGAYTLDDGKTYRFAQTSGLTGSDGYYVRVVDNQDESTGVDDPATDHDDTIHIISRGRVGMADRTLETVVKRDGTAPCVICGNQHIPLPLASIIDVVLAAGVTTDSYDSRSGPYAVATAHANGNIIGNGDISLTGALLLPTTIRGDVTAARNVVTVLPPVNVTGQIRQFQPATEFPPVLPCGPPYPANTGITGGLYNRAAGILVSVGLNDVITLAPGDYCFSAITMAGSSTLRVTGPTHVSLTLPSSIVGVINTTGIASNLRVESSVVSPVPVLPGIIPALTVVGLGNSISMVVNAPQAIVTVAGVSTDFYGQIIGGIVPSVATTRLHYDEALDNPSLYRLGWRELRNDPPG